MINQLALLGHLIKIITPLVIDGCYVTHKSITLPCISFIFIEMKFIHFHSCVMFTMKSMSIFNDYVNYNTIIILRSLVFKCMFSTFLFVRYLIRISNYLERIVLSVLTHIMSMADPIAISVETLRIDSGCSLDKESTKLIRVNLSMIFYHVHITVVS